MLVPVSPQRAMSQAPAASGAWQTYTDSTYGYSLSYPAEWAMARAFDNPKGKAYIIRRRVVFENTTGTQVHVDVWDKDARVPLEDWLQAVENITSTLEVNAVLSGQDSLVVVQSGECGVLTTLSTYVPSGQRVYKIFHQYTGDAEGLEVYEAILQSFSLTGRGISPENTFPDLAPMVPSTCGTNICPSTCSGGCTFAAVRDGCCGYHRVPRWQCSKECLGDQIGGFVGNCTWWGAYTRRDVGELASGNASNWAISVRNTGQLPVDRIPKVGDIVVHPGSSYNHVAYVVWVAANGASYRVSDMGWCADCGPTPEEAKLYRIDGDDEFIHCAGDPAIPATDWRFTDCPFGWTPSKGFTTSGLDGSAWILNPGSDPYLLSPFLSVPASDYHSIILSLANHAQDTAAKIYFTTSASSGFDEAKAVAFPTFNDGEWHDYRVYMQAHPLWQGTITRIQVHPIGSGNKDASYDDVGIAQIRFDSTDTTPPTAPTNLQPGGPPETWYGNYTRTQRPTFTWDPSIDPESGIAGYYVGLDRGDRYRVERWHDVGYVKLWQTPTLGEGEHHLVVAAENGAGLHAFSTRFPFVVDTRPPSNPAYVHAGCTGQNNLWQNECYDPAFAWSGAYDHGGAGVKDYHYYWGPSEAGLPVTYSSGTDLNPGPITTPDGCASYYLNMATRDNLEQEGVSGPAFVLRYDGQAPTGAAVIIDGGSGTTGQISVRLDISADDACSGVVEMRLSNNQIAWTDWLPYQGTMLWHLPTLDRHWIPVYVQVRDRAGNESAIAQDSIYLELYPEKPHSESFRLCADAIDAGGQAKSSPSFSMVGAIGQPLVDDGLAGADIRGAAGLLGTAGSCPTSWGFSSGYRLTGQLLASDGGLSSSANVQLAGSGGQAVASGATPSSSSSYQVSAGFWSNPSGPLPAPPPATTPPFTPSLSLEPYDKRFGIQAGGLGLSYTNQVTTLLTFWAPSVDQLQVSRLPDFADATWQSYVPTMTWDYAPDGVVITGTRIYARFRDEAGTIYGDYESTVFYDAVPPLGWAEVMTVTGGIATLALEASDDNSGVGAMRLAAEPSFVHAPWQLYSDTVTIPWPVGGIVYVQYRDRAGNVSPTVSIRDRYKIYLPLVTKRH